MNVFQNSSHMILQGCLFSSIEIRCHWQQTQREEKLIILVTETELGFPALQILLGASQLDVIHDSAAHQRALESTAATHHANFVDPFALWATRKFYLRSVALLTGPRSDLAQLCAERLGVQLAATYFLSEFHNKNPGLFVPTIALQLATKSRCFAKILEGIILRNPTLLTKALRVQFYELIVVPFKKLRCRDPLRGRVIIVDGFDHFLPHVRRDIVRAVTSATKEGLPLRWAFFSEERYDEERGAMGSSSDASLKELFWEVNLFELDRERIEIDCSELFEHVESKWALTCVFIVLCLVGVLALYT